MTTTQPAPVSSIGVRLERRLLLRVVRVSEDELSQTVLELDEVMRDISDEGPGIDLEIENVVNQALGIQ